MHRVCKVIIEFRILSNKDRSINMSQQLCVLLDALRIGVFRRLGDEKTTPKKVPS